MTISQNKFNDLRDTLPSIQLVFEDLPKRYSVMVGKTNNGTTDWLIGHVVTFLSIQDWCDMHGYVLREVYPGTRFAFPSEMKHPIDLV